jgi:hypothetical protein
MDPWAGRGSVRGSMVARLPKGWAGEEPVRPEASNLPEDGRLSDSGTVYGRLRDGLPRYFLIQTPAVAKIAGVLFLRWVVRAANTSA